MYLRKSPTWTVGSRSGSIYVSYFVFVLFSFSFCFVKKCEINWEIRSLRCIPWRRGSLTHYAYSWGCYMQNFSPKCTILGAIICYYYASAIWTYGWNWIKPWSLNLLASHFSQFPLSTHINKCFSVMIKITIVRWVTNKLVGVLDLRREKRRAGSSSIRGPSWNEDWEEIHNLIYL